MDYSSGKAYLINNFLRMIQLDFNKTIPYLIEHIKCGNLLSQKVIKRVDFKKGNFYTILPDNYNLNNLYCFQNGGILKFYAENSILQNNLTEFIFKSLENNFSNYAVFENLMVDSESPYAEVENIETSYYQKEVYYFLNKKNNVNDIRNLIRKTEQVWHFLIILTAIEKKSRNLNERDLDTICDKIKFLVTWQPQPSPIRKKSPPNIDYLDDTWE